MKVLFAVENEGVSNSIVKKYQKEYKEILACKNVYFFNAILKELQKDKTYDAIVISETLEQFANSNTEQMDKFIIERLDGISDEAVNSKGEDIPIILICSERREKGEQLLVKIFGLGIYNALIGDDRNIDEVCQLINRPRSKKEAKSYYKIDVDKVEYSVEKENDVSEIEIQNILAHYKRLGKNEDKYVEAFSNISTQYNDIQLKLICNFLPLNVRAVLEEQSPKYQELMSLPGGTKVKSAKSAKKNNVGTTEKLLGLGENTGKLAPKQIIVPKVLGEKDIKRIKKDTNTDKTNSIMGSNQQVQYEEEKEEKIEPVVKRGRGRPKKVVEEPVKEEPVVKKGRGRPKKVIEEPNEEIDLFSLSQQANDEEENQEPDMFGLTNSIKDKGISNTGSVYDDNNEYEEDENDDSYLPGMQIENSNNNISTVNLPKMSSPIPGSQMEYMNDYNRIEQKQEPIESAEELENILSQGKKIVTFVGSPKNGTSFIVNNLAELLSSMGINTAILDMTKNKNSYYIYTRNDDELRKIAFTCITNLKQGIAKGITTNKNLTVYTSLPSEDDYNSEITILQTIAQKHDIILIDCDYETPLEYFRQAQEIYLVQSMDILTIQPLTAFLKKLKERSILNENKIRIVINKYLKLKTISEKSIIGGMSSYKDPAMSFMTSLFDRNKVNYIVLPFDEEIYVNYLDGLVNCDISLKDYIKSAKKFMQNLKQLGNAICQNRGKSFSIAQNENKDNSFSNNTNNVLNQMRKNQRK